MTGIKYMDYTSSDPLQIAACTAWFPSCVAVAPGLPVPSLLVVVPTFHLWSKVYKQGGWSGVGWWGVGIGAVAEGCPVLFDD